MNPRGNAMVTETRRIDEAFATLNLELDPRAGRSAFSRPGSCPRVHLRDGRRASRCPHCEDEHDHAR